jgi:hypothetical protein
MPINIPMEAAIKPIAQRAGRADKEHRQHIAAVAFGAQRVIPTGDAKAKRIGRGVGAALAWCGRCRRRCGFCRMPSLASGCLRQRGCRR